MTKRHEGRTAESWAHEARMLADALAQAVDERHVAQLALEQEIEHRRGCDETLQQAWEEAERLRGVIEAIAKGTEHVISIPREQADDELWVRMVEAGLRGGRAAPAVITSADEILEEIASRRIGDEPPLERLIPESREDYLRRRGWRQREISGAKWWERDAPGTSSIESVQGIDRAYEIQSAEDAPGGVRIHPALYSGLELGIKLSPHSRVVRYRIIEFEFRSDGPTILVLEPA